MEKCIGSALIQAIPSTHEGGETGKVIPIASKNDLSTSSRPGMYDHPARPYLSSPNSGRRSSKARVSPIAAILRRNRGFLRSKRRLRRLDALKWAYCCAKWRRSHAGDYAIENTILDLARRRPYGVRERRARRPRCGADGCGPLGEEGRSRQVGGMVSVRRAQRRV